MYSSTQIHSDSFKTGSIINQVGSLARPLLSNRCSYCVSNVFPIPTIACSPSIGVDRVAVEIPLVPSKSDAKALLSTIKNTLLGRWGTRAKAVH